MGELFKSFSLVPRGLRYKLLLAFSLMSLIPLLICAYLANNYIFPYIKADMGQISLVIFVAIVIALLGLKLAKEIVDPVVRIALEARDIARGDVREFRYEARGDEIGDLGESLHAMTKRIQENMEELQTYGEKTKEINLQVNKKVLALSNLLQVGTLITTGGGLKEIFQYVIEKISQIEEGSKSFLLVLDEQTKELKTVASYDITHESFSNATIKLGIGVLGNCVVDRKGIRVDSKNRNVPKGVEEILSQWGVKNALVIPIVSRSRGMGLLGVGNNDPNFVFAESNEDIYRIFTRQITIAIENDHLTKRTKELEIKDELTGLFNKSFIEQRLAEEIKRVAYSQRPCSFVLCDIDGFKEFAAGSGALACEGALKKIALLINGTITDIDRAARFGDDEFAILLPEKNKREAIETAETVRQGIENLHLFGNHGKSQLTVSIGVSENPIDGTTSEDLVKRAKLGVEYAKQQGKNRVTGVIPQGVSS